MKKSVTDDFQRVLKTEVLQAVHKAINILNNDCTMHNGSSLEILFKDKIEELKNTVNTFADEELTVYKRLFYSPIK